MYLVMIRIIERFVLNKFCFCFLYSQVSAPEYIFLISDLAGERRFASIVAKRLESLGALTHGDRRATESRDLSQFNIDTKYGRAALDATMKAVMGYEVPVVPPPPDYKGEFFKGKISLYFFFLYINLFDLFFCFVFLHLYRCCSSISGCWPNL